jgi:2-succinyl-6-hydroxy-2,4-cyclohexadiene-1-carboxylate synthase
MRSRWVLLHGFSGHPSSWDEVARALFALGNVLRPALVGHSPDTGPSLDFMSEVDRIARHIAARGPGPYHLSGYSLGARVALGLLVHYPALFNRATLIGVHPGLPVDGNERSERAELDERWASLAESDARDFFARWAQQPLFESQRGVEPARRAAQQRIREEHDAAALGRAMRALSLARMPDWHPFLPEIAVPVHLVVGELDSKFVGLACQMKKQLRSSRLTIVRGAGHNVLLECPSEVCNALLLPAPGTSGEAVDWTD